MNGHPYGALCELQAGYYQDTNVRSSDAAAARPDTSLVSWASGGLPVYPRSSESKSTNC